MSAPTGPLVDELIGVTRDRDSASVGLREARVEVERLQAQCAASGKLVEQSNEYARSAIEQRDEQVHTSAVLAAELTSEHLDEVTRLEDRVEALTTARDSRLEPLRKALVTLADAVWASGPHADGVVTLAAEVIESHARGTL